MRSLLLYLTISIISINANSQSFAWAKQFGASNVTINGSYLAPDGSGNIVAHITFTGVVDFDPGTAVFSLNATNGSIVVLTLSSSGNFISARQINLPTNTMLAEDGDGNIYYAGNLQNTMDVDPGAGVYNLTSAGYGDVFVGKLDANGNFVWAVQLGGTGAEEYRYMAINSQGNVYISGTFGYVGSYDLDKTIDFDPDPDNSYTLTSTGSPTPFIWCLNANGGFVWAQIIAGSVVHADNAGNCYLFIRDASTNNTTHIAKIDPNGNSLWSKQISTGWLEIGRLTTNDAGEILLCGGFNGNILIGQYNLVSTTIQDPYFTKMDNAGNVLWAKSIRGNGFVQDITGTADGNIYITGYYSGTGPVDFDPGPATFTMKCNNNVAAYIEKITAAGNFVWARQLGGEKNSNNRGRKIAVGANGDIFTMLSFYGTIDFDPGAGKFNLSAKGPRDLVIHKMTQPNNGLRQPIVEKETKEQLIVSAISANTLGVKLPGLNETVTISVIDMSGRVIYQEKVTAGTVQHIPLPFAKGVYSITAQYKDKLFLARTPVLQQ